MPPKCLSPLPKGLNGGGKADSEFPVAAVRDNGQLTDLYEEVVYVRVGLGRGLQEHNAKRIESKSGL